jgi:uncharacterized NAD-dependent epimerase/dehydratase family protein
LSGFEGIRVLTPQEAMPLYLAAARLTNPQAHFVGVSLNTSAMSPIDASVTLRSTQEALGLPCVDPIRTGVVPIVQAMESFR